METQVQTLTQALAQHLPQQVAEERARNIVMALADGYEDVRDTLHRALVGAWMLTDYEPIPQATIEELALYLDAQRA